jgi:hypothetical protein
MLSTFFTAMKKIIDLKLQPKNKVKHDILYVHFVDLLIWSPIQLDFPFYESMICYDFSKMLQGLI